MPLMGGDSQNCLMPLVILLPMLELSVLDPERGNADAGLSR